MHHRFDKMHLANQKEGRLFLRCPSLENLKWKVYFPIKQYRIWIYNSLISFHTRIAEVVSQIQYDTP